MTYEIKKQQIIDQQIFESNIKDPTKFSLNQEYNFADDDNQQNVESKLFLFFGRWLTFNGSRNTINYK